MLAILMAGSAPVSAAQTGAAASAAADGAELDRLVDDVCGREVVLLGEDNHHGSGRTFELKSILVKRLVQEYGFNQVLFEGQFYEFIDFERTVAAGSSGRPPQVAVAQLSTPAGDMLEARMPPAPPASIRYLDRASLAGLSSLPARALDYTKPQTADWSETVDGLVVLAEKRPLGSSGSSSTPR